MKPTITILILGILFSNFGYSQIPDASNYLFGQLQEVDMENAPGDLILPVKTSNGDWRLLQLRKI